jgi:hypothetical protein
VRAYRKRPGEASNAVAGYWGPAAGSPAKEIAA